jgi:hypothetical protein
MTTHALTEIVHQTASALAAAPLTPEEAARLAAFLSPLLEGLRALDDLDLREVEPALTLALGAGERS